MLIWVKNIELASLNSDDDGSSTNISNGNKDVVINKSGFLKGFLQYLLSKENRNEDDDDNDRLVRLKNSIKIVYII